jgi:hypothetical protein
MLRRNHNKVLKKIEGEATVIVEGDGEVKYDLPIFEASLPGTFKVKYKITVEQVKHTSRSL